MDIIKQDLTIEKEYYENLFNVYLYLKGTKERTCLLCGKQYRSHKDLEKKIDETINKINVLENYNDPTKVIMLGNKILNDVKSKQNSVLFSYFNDYKQCETLSRARKIIKLYKYICDFFLYSYQERLNNIKIQDDNDIVEYGSVQEELSNINNKIFFKTPEKMTAPIGNE